MQDSNNLKDSLENLIKVTEKIHSWINSNSEFIGNAVLSVYRYMLFQEAGWFFHYTTPISLIEDVSEAGKLTDILNSYYTSNWAQVRMEFEKRLAMYDVDEEAKATFSEGLDAHEHGLYRVNSRLLFPEIERVARVDLLNGQLRGFASLKEIREAAGNLGLSELAPPGGGPVFAQFVKMSHHFYENAHAASMRTLMQPKTLRDLLVILLQTVMRLYMA